MVEEIYGYQHEWKLGEYDIEQDDDGGCLYNDERATWVTAYTNPVGYWSLCRPLRRPVDIVSKSLISNS